MSTSNLFCILFCVLQVLVDEINGASRGSSSNRNPGTLKSSAVTGGCKNTKIGSEYMGKVNVSKSGRKCKRWGNRAIRRTHSRYDWTFPDRNTDAAKNYCRNPNGAATGPWCYTSLSRLKKEICDIPFCYEVKCKYTKRGREFKGKLDVAKSGRRCLKWSTIPAYENSPKKEYGFPEASVQEAKNYCRNPNGDKKGPWCFTGRNRKKEYCLVHLCHKEECKYSELGTEYNGMRSFTKSGFNCQRWDRKKPQEHSVIDGSKFPEQSTTAAKNYCRNPDATTGGPWCYTTDGPRWQHCKIKLCKKRECKYSVLGREYRGKLAVTRSGRKCQRWDTQLPHGHSMTNPEKFPMDGRLSDAQNYCRNPDDSPHGPWCFTVDSAVQWDYCDLRLCRKKNPKGCNGIYKFKYNNNCIAMLEKPETFHGARAVCQSMGGYLLLIRSYRMQKYIVKQIKAFQQSNTRNWYIGAWTDWNWYGHQYGFQYYYYHYYDRFHNYISYSRWGWNEPLWRRITWCWRLLPRPSNIWGWFVSHLRRRRYGWRQCSWWGYVWAAVMTTPSGYWKAVNENDWYGYLCGARPGIDGNWGAWSGATTCSVTCGHGKSTKRRRCDSPHATGHGNPCEGEAVMNIPCFSHHCTITTDYTKPPPTHCAIPFAQDDSLFYGCMATTYGELGCPSVPVPRADEPWHTCQGYKELISCNPDYFEIVCDSTDEISIVSGKFLTNISRCGTNEGHEDSIRTKRGDNGHSDDGSNKEETDANDDEQKGTTIDDSGEEERRPLKLINQMYVSTLDALKISAGGIIDKPQEGSYIEYSFDMRIRQHCNRKKSCRYAFRPIDNDQKQPFFGAIIRYTCTKVLPRTQGSCKFPFIYSRKNWFQCITTENTGKPWCGSSDNVDRHKDEGIAPCSANNLQTYGIKDVIRKCAPSFRLDGQIITGCTDKGKFIDPRSKLLFPWCATTDDYDKDGEWKPCPESKS